MSEWTRRRALQALAVGLAGCSEEASFAERPDRDPRGGRPVEYAARKVRDTDGSRLFWTGEDRPTPSEGRPGRGFRTVNVDAATVTFAPDSDPAATLEAFVAGTDSTARTVVLATAGVGECYDLRLTHVGRGPEGLYTSFCRRLRPSGTACETGRLDRLAFGIRVPSAGEPGDVSVAETEVYRPCGVEPPRPVLPDTTTAEGDDG